MYYIFHKTKRKCTKNDSIISLKTWNRSKYDKENTEENDDVQRLNARSFSEICILDSLEYIYNFIEQIHKS